MVNNVLKHQGEVEIRLQENKLIPSGILANFPEYSSLSLDHAYTEN